ncbi:cation-transporting P-type ATPase, partial [Haemophilus parainfluenzae]|uniref:cation-transporting P-type ATPase n=1 Tax=Haemophilus parainfluenzae TaxID=729 RepID=UPI00124BB7C6
MTFKHPDAATQSSERQPNGQRQLETIAMPELESRLRVSPEQGLTQAEAQQRLAQSGYNELAE